MSDTTLAVRNWVTGNGALGEVLLYEKDINGDWDFSINLNEVEVGDGIREDASIIGSGVEVAIEGDLLAVTVNGRPQALDPEAPMPDQQRVNVYRRDETSQWVLTQVILDPEPEAGREFGSSLAIDGGRLLIGAESSRGPISTPGAAYLYTPIPEPSAACLAVLSLAALISHRRLCA